MISTDGLNQAHVHWETEKQNKIKITGFSDEKKKQERGVKEKAPTKMQRHVITFFMSSAM